VTSNRALQYARRLVGAAKAGHAGTLDPMATGLLPLLFGHATRFAGYVSDADKEYVATLRLGIRTDSGDITGSVVSACEPSVDADQVAETIAGFVGIISQVPPMHSALRVNGQRLYRLAHQGVSVPRVPRTVTVHSIEVLAVRLPDIDLAVACSKGTYIRTLVENIGDKLRCGATLTSLRRTRVGRLTVAGAQNMEAFEGMSQPARMNCLLPPDWAVGALGEVWVSQSEARGFGHGQALRVGAAAGLLRVYDIVSGKFLGLGSSGGGGLTPHLVLPQ
jgi:tRNA pseudouridine55 synthase